MSLDVNRAARISKIFSFRCESSQILRFVSQCLLPFSLSFSLTLNLDPGVIYQQLQQLVRAAVGEVYFDGVLLLRKYAEVGDYSVWIDLALQALSEAVI